MRKAVTVICSLICVFASMFTSRAGDPVVSLDKRWVNFFGGLYSPPNNAGCKQSMWFADSAKFEDKVYYRLVSIANTNDSSFYMRQDGQKVYMRINDRLRDFIGKIEDAYYVRDDNERIEVMNWVRNLENETEYLIYDFDAKPGDKFPAFAILDERSKQCWDFMNLPFDMGLYPTFLKVRAVFEINVGGQKRICQEFYNSFQIHPDEWSPDIGYMIEGIGFIDGILMFSRSWMDRTAIDTCRLNFEGFYDGDMKLIVSRSQAIEAINEEKNKQTDTGGR